MNSIRINGDMVSIFSVAQAHAQLESDYNKEGMLQERPSNQRRNESTGCQLSRLGYSSPYGWVDIIPNEDTVEDCDDDDVRYIYLSNVLEWGLPIDDDMAKFMSTYFTREHLEKFPHFLVAEAKISATQP